MALDIPLEELLQYMDPDVLDQMVQSGLAQQRGALAGKSATLGAEMMNTPSAQGRTVRNGIYVAASPLEHLSTAIRQYQGAKRLRGGEAEQAAQIDAQGTGTRGLLDTIRQFGARKPEATTVMPELDLTQF